MNVSKDKVVIMHYKVSDQNGRLLDSTFKSNPLAFLYGKSNVLPALEDGIEGLEEGEEFSFEVQPNEGFGLLDAQKIMKIPRSCFEEEEIKVGNRYDIKGKGITRRVTIKEVFDEEVEIDENHPLAGIILVFEGHILRVRKASNYEMKSGNVDN